MTIRKVYVTGDELLKLKNIGNGTYGDVYADENEKVIYKIYKEKVKSFPHDYVKNPCLRVNKNKMKRLNDRNEKIKHTDTSIELVYQGSKFIGVRKTYYEGSVLEDYSSEQLSVKKELLKQLIRNASELNSNKIYDLDYKLNNIMVTNDGIVKIIDLDDIFTKVTFFPNWFYKKGSLKMLRNTIHNFLYYNHLVFPGEIVERVSNSCELKKTKENLSFEMLEEFVDRTMFDEDIIIIKADDVSKIDVNILKTYLDENGLSLVLAVNGNYALYSEKLKDTFDFLDSCKLDVYDVFRYKDDYDLAKNIYIAAHESYNAHTFDDNEFKKVKK